MNSNSGGLSQAIQSEKTWSERLNLGGKYELSQALVGACQRLVYTRRMSYLGRALLYASTAAYIMGPNARIMNSTTPSNPLSSNKAPMIASNLSAISLRVL